MIVPLFRAFTRRVLRNPPVPVRVAAFLLATLAYGTTGFLYFELGNKPDLAWPDAFWWSLVTLTTIGYGDIYPATPGGRFLVAVPLMFFGIGMLGYVLSMAATKLIEAKSKELSGMGEVNFRGHVVICNLPSVEKVARILDELRLDPTFRDKDVVLVDEHLESLPRELLDRHVHFVRGNPSRDRTLGRANVDAASHAIVLSKVPGESHSDDLALAVTLAIEARAPGVRTTTECVDPEHEELLRKAGADSIVSFGRYEAHFVSNEVLHPGLQDVFGELLTVSGQQLHLVPCSAKTFAEACDAARRSGHIAIGVRRGADTHLNVPPDWAFRSDDRVVTIGDRRLDRL